MTLNRKTLDQTIMNTNQHIDKQKQLLHDAEHDVNESNQALESFINEWEAVSEHCIEDLDTLQSLKLVLQYRLDTQHILSQLNQLQQYLLQILGIEAQHSLEMNIERLGFALGTDDLKQLLSMLSSLVDSLLRILAHNPKQSLVERKKLMERLQKRKELPALTKALEKLHSFENRINRLKLSLEDIAEAPHPGVIYDHIAALEGPISRFQQALNHGLKLSYGVHYQMHQKHQLRHQLTDTMQNTKQLMEKLEQTMEPHRLFTPTKDHIPRERLEERAIAKRLGNFFNR